MIKNQSSSIHSNNRPTILIVDDDPQLIEYVRVCLERENWQIFTASNGKNALELVEKRIISLILLDIVMPEIDGKEVCRRIRNQNLIFLPIIMLSCRAELADKIECLDMGADDYITKPFNDKELVSRIKAVLRRNQPITSPQFNDQVEYEGLKIDFLANRVISKGKEKRLTPTEHNLLRELVINAGKPLSYEYLLNKVWGPEYKFEREYLHVYIGHLRAKIEPNPDHPRYIITEHGMGYVFNVT
jgi:two-component system, OmpR family, KDP operon response regulator KdpE